MAIPTTRTKENAEIRIREETCIVCGSCVSVCKDFSLIMEAGKIRVSGKPAFGCMACGHCMAICPSGAIEIFGRTMSPADLFALPPAASSTNYDQLLSLYQRRRSVREFTGSDVEPEIADKILRAAVTAPMGLPPSDVHVLVLDSREKNRAFAGDFCNYLQHMQWFVSKWFLALMRPIWGKANDGFFRGFLRPLFRVYLDSMKTGVNLVNYDAPLAMYFYGSPYSDPADAVVAATTAMYAGESLGLGTCMIGGIHPLIQNGQKAKNFRRKHGIKYASKQGLFVIFGYPAVQYQKGINRSFASVTVGA